MLTLLFEYDRHCPSPRAPNQARQVPVAVVVELVECSSATNAGTAAAATASAPKVAIRRARVFAVVISDLSPETGSTLTITRCQFSRSEVVSAGLFQQAAPIGLQRHQVAEQRVILVALLHRRHPLQLGLDLGDLPAHPDLL